MDQDTNRQLVNQNGLIGIFCNHPVAANLLMAVMLISGIWAMQQLNTQFLPSYENENVQVRVLWSGASAEDIRELITIPLEQDLRDVDNLKDMTSTSAEGVSSITLEFDEGTDMGEAVDKVKERVNITSGLPTESETPEVSKTTFYEEVGRLLLTGLGSSSIDELRGLVYQFERELLDLGIAKINIHGIPEEQIAIEVPSYELKRLSLSLDELGQRITAWSRDVPLGIIGRSQTSRQLRFQERRETAAAFEEIPIVANQQGSLLSLGDIAEISRKPKPDQEKIFYKGYPAIELVVMRTESADSLDSAKILSDWVEQTRPLLPQGVELVFFNQIWELIQGRINILIENGLSGLILVVMILYLFMASRIAFWTAVGIPVSFMAALFILYLWGGSLNMVSMFALIMTLGIIVDDSIVVGEDAMSRYSSGVKPSIASLLAARRMLSPIFCSSLTTIAAFMPLFLVGGNIGTIMQTIPLVVVCVIIASLIECFLILPGHLTHSFHRMGPYNPTRVRLAIDNRYIYFRENLFRPFISLVISHRWSTLAVALSIMLLSVAWVQSGRINFTFFPSTEGDTLFLNVGFVSGSSPDQVTDFLTSAIDILYQIEEESGEPLISLVMTRYGATEGRERTTQRGDHLGGIRIDLLPPDQRTTRNSEIVRTWRSRLNREPGIETLTLIDQRAGPGSSDIDLKIYGQEVDQIKKVSESVKNVLSEIPGLSGISDDIPYGREQLVLSLTPSAEALGLTIDSISRQLRAAYDGFLVQEISDGFEDLDVVILIPERERDALTSISGINILLPNGRTESMSSLVKISTKRGFETIRHSKGRLAISVKADVDYDISNANQIVERLKSDILPPLVAEHGITYSFEGDQSDQQKTLDDMRLGGVIALALIYLVLSWAFGSYGWPFVVMIIIPFGFIGGLWGHVLMDKDITLLSLFGFFGLSGIVVNNSIILLVFYQWFRKSGMPAFEAIIEATCSRLRAVILTSLTTIGGLTPLLFETSIQAQFLIPMAISLAFGLAFATLLVLCLVPSLLLMYENFHAKVFPSQNRMIINDEMGNASSQPPY
ncbi:MAG: efflux RND transporter permease subunit [Gammaproteobacteria bacterium]|nr:efflux RND transporter permease subunit [Gammaproteobacteria bacterium]